MQPNNIPRQTMARKGEAGKGSDGLLQWLPISIREKAESFFLSFGFFPCPNNAQHKKLSGLFLLAFISHCFITFSQAWNHFNSTTPSKYKYIIHTKKGKVKRKVNKCAAAAPWRFRTLDLRKRSICQLTFSHENGVYVD